MIWTKLMMNKFLFSSFQKNKNWILFSCAVSLIFCLSHLCVYLPPWHITNICTHTLLNYRKKLRGEVCAFILKGNLANFRFPRLALPTWRPCNEFLRQRAGWQAHWRSRALRGVLTAAAVASVPTVGGKQPVLQVLHSFTPLLYSPKNQTLVPLKSLLLPLRVVEIIIIVVASWVSSGHVGIALQKFVPVQRGAAPAGTELRGRGDY